MTNVVHSDIYVLSYSLLIITPFQQGIALEDLVLPDFTRQNCNYILSLLNSIIKSLSIFHNNSIIHSNIKPSNIFVNDNESVCYIDSSQHLLSNINLSFENVYYKSPEIIQNKYYDNSTDIWSLGCVLYNLFYRNTPICSINYKNNFRKIRRNISNNINSSYPIELNILIQNMIQINPSNRYKCKTIIDIINNPNFFKTNKKSIIIPKTSDITSINLQNPNLISCITHSRPYRSHSVIKDLENCIYCNYFKLLSYNLQHYSNIIELSLSSINKVIIS